MNTSKVTTTRTTTSRRTRRDRTNRLHLSCRILGHSYRQTPGDPEVLTCVGCGTRELRVVKQIRDTAQRIPF